MFLRQDYLFKKWNFWNFLKTEKRYRQTVCSSWSPSLRITRVSLMTLTQKLRKNYKSPKNPFSSPPNNHKNCNISKTTRQIFFYRFYTSSKLPILEPLANFQPNRTGGKKDICQNFQKPVSKPPNNQKNCNISKTARQNFFYLCTLRHNFPF